jgi:hypothetical protein
MTTREKTAEVLRIYNELVNQMYFVTLTADHKVILMLLAAKLANAY